MVVVIDTFSCVFSTISFYCLFVCLGGGRINKEFRVSKVEEEDAI